MGLLWSLLVCKSVQHIAKESFEAGLVGAHSEFRILIQLINVLFASVEAKHDNLLHLVFEDFYYSWEDGRVNKVNIVFLFSLLKDCWDLLNKLLHSLLSELPALMEYSYCAFLTKEG